MPSPFPPFAGVGVTICITINTFTRNLIVLKFYRISLTEAGKKFTHTALVCTSVGVEKGAVTVHMVFMPHA